MKRLGVLAKLSQALGRADYSPRGETSYSILSHPSVPIVWVILLSGILILLFRDA